MVSFRTVPARFAVCDVDAATVAALDACPAVVTVEMVSRLDRRALLDYVEQTGELLAGVELVPASESVKITVGAERRG